MPWPHFGIIALVGCTAATSISHGEMLQAHPDDPSREFEAPAPTYRLTPRLPREAGSLSILPLDLIGFDLVRQGSESIEGLPIRYTEGDNLVFTLFLRPWGVLASDTVLHLRVEGEGPALGKSYELDSARWEVGGVYLQDITYRHPRLRTTGRAKLVITADASIGGRDAEARLYEGPVHISPVKLSSKENADRLRDVFGETASRLDATFRLGPGASLSLPLSQDVPVSGFELGLVSFFTYDHTKIQSERVCRIDLVGVNEDVLASEFVEAGVSTAYAWYDHVAHGVLAHNRTEIFSSVRVGRQGPDGDTFESHSYVSRIPLRTNEQPRLIRFTFLPNRGVFEVREVMIGHLRQPTQ